MPIYEYVCSSCGSEFEAIQKFSDEPLNECACGKQGTVERKLSLSAFQLKGGGWYKDMYGSSNGGGNGKSNGSSASKASSSDGAAATSSDGAKSSDTAKSSDSTKSSTGSSATASA